MEDPGGDLKRVLEFKEKLIAEKEILFKEFPTVRELEPLVRKKVIAYVNSVREADAASELKEVRAKPAEPEPEKENVEKKNLDSSPFSAEGFAFLENFVDKIGQKDVMDNLSASDVARFRLVANSISKPGNEEMALGVHDINILFSTRITEGMRLDKSEIRYLARLGVYHLSNENVPFWCWYSDLSRLDAGIGVNIDAALDEVLSSSLFGANDDEKIRAFSVLSTLECDIPTDEGYRTWTLGLWFSKESSAHVRSAALEYLTKMGTAEDYTVAKKEHDRSNFVTSQKAFECMVGILLRTGQENSAQQLILDSPSQQLILDSPFESLSLDADMLQAVLDGFKNLETEKLLPGLEHRNVQVRLRTLKVLLERGSLDAEMAERLSRDSDASIRNEAFTALLKLGRSFTEEEVKTILIAEGGSDEKGEEFFARYQLESLKKFPEGELSKKVESSLMFNEAVYFARVEKYFAKHVKELRRDIDDTFKAYFEEKIRRIKTLFSFAGKDFSDAETEYRDIENFLRRKLTRQGLDILCRASKREDLQRIRGNLQGSYAGASKADAKYLGKYGEWTDISLLSNAGPPMGGYEDFQEEIAKAILRAYTKIAFQLINRSWRPTLSLSFALNQEEESHGHQDRFARSDLAYTGCLVEVDRSDSGAGKTTRHRRTPGHTQPSHFRRHYLCVT